MNYSDEVGLCQSFFCIFLDLALLNDAVFLVHTVFPTALVKQNTCSRNRPAGKLERSTVSLLDPGIETSPMLIEAKGTRLLREKLAKGRPHRSLR